MISTDIFNGILGRSIHQRGLNLWKQVNNPLSLFGSGGSRQPGNNSTLGMMIVRFRSNRSRRGLYDGKDIRAGNQLCFSMKSSKRTFKPNVFVKRLYSEVLDEMIRFRVSAAALRTMDKFGGLDNYLLKSEHVIEGTGMDAKRRILKKLKVMEAKKREEDEARMIFFSKLATDAGNATNSV